MSASKLCSSVLLLHTRRHCSLLSSRYVSSIYSCGSSTTTRLLPLSTYLPLYGRCDRCLVSTSSKSVLLKEQKPMEEEKIESVIKDEKKAEQPVVELSKRDRLKQTIKDYGSTVLVFHISMSLCSLGLCYLLVSSGLDVVSLLEKIGVGEKIRESSLTTGASTFVIAYAVHKVFAPLRITITLTATPLIVKKLRSLGVLKKVKRSS